MQYTPTHTLSIEADDAANQFMRKVYGWMAFALAISGGMAFYVANDPTIFNFIFSRGLFTALIIVELGLVIALSWLINKINAFTATLFFVIYSLVTGLTLSVIFLAYEFNSIVSIFTSTAMIFAAMSIYGYITRRNLTGIGTLAMFGLIGIIIASLINMFVGNGMVDTIIAGIGVIVFIVLTAYDTQKIKMMSLGHTAWTDDSKKAAISGALMLYLDFINLFLSLLRLFGNRR